MPIDRPDGRHWCAPEREPAPAIGQWVCPGCGTVWLYNAETRVWARQTSTEDGA